MIKGMQKQKTPRLGGVLWWHLATVYVLTVGELGPHKRRI